MDTAQAAKGHVAEAPRTTGAAVHERVVAAKEGGTEAALAAKHKAAHLASNRTVQVAAASAAGGAVVAGGLAGAAGLAAGGALGAAAGLVPAVFTFGLSIPVMALVGSGCGALAATALGGTAGLVAGGAGGYGLCKAWPAISHSATYAKDTACSTAGHVREMFVGTTGGTTQ